MRGFTMKLRQERAQSMVEYVVIFAALTALAGVTLAAIMCGQFQNTLKAWFGGS
jgi:hypothetical protein